MTNVADMKKLAEDEARRDAKLGQLNQAFGLALLVSLIVTAFAGGLNHAASTMLWAFACLAVGAFIGLLFGIPRIRQGKAIDPDPARPGADSSRAEVNNNLVEVSDWLTKIIVGVGLVELASLPQKLKQVAGPLTRCLDSECGMAVAVGVIIFFAFAGFLAGYINARTLIAAMLVNSDRDLLKQFENKINALEVLSDTMEEKALDAGVPLPGQSIKVATQADAEARPSVVVPAVPPPAVSPAVPVVDVNLPGGAVVGSSAPAADAPTDAPVPAEPLALPAELATDIPVPAAQADRRRVSESVVDPDDPHKGQFGGEPQRNGRVFEATIEPRSGQRSGACWVRFRVRSIDPAKPLTGIVTFFLHPTFGRYKKFDVTVKDGVAEDTVLSWGAFTAGAVTDGGATRLELDLVGVPGGNQRFYEE